MPYVDSVVKALSEIFNDEVIFIYNNKGKFDNYQPSSNVNAVYLKRSEFIYIRLKELIQAFNPKIIFVSGRMDMVYLRAVLGEKENRSIVMGSDEQFNINFKQLTKIIFSYFLYKRYFTHVWVPGNRQLILSKALGFSSERIITNLYSGDLSTFNKDSQKSITEKKQFVYIGRLEHVKGFDLLLEAWRLIPNSEKLGWDLLIFGDGSLKRSISASDDIVYKGFKKQSEIISSISSDAVFVLPSRYEPWGVVVHEMAAIGLPLILSKEVGASDCFLIDNYNGKLLIKVDKYSIANAIKFFIHLNFSDRKKMGENSIELSKRINPIISAASLRSIIK